MGYRKDLVSAARRHLKGGQLLYETSAPGSQPGCKAVAGYLFGLAGELAVKELMRASGMKEQPLEGRRSDPFYAHFPGLKTLLAGIIRGRRAGELRQLAEDSRLFQYWDTDMRYAPTGDVQEDWVACWKVSAERLIEKMNLQ